MILVILTCAGCTTTFHLEDAQAWNSKHDKELTAEMLLEGGRDE
tara:strand:+ start:21965 stop:22096 length:132 start_codon:yes stop_codon:yes gene_type:complete